MRLTTIATALTALTLTGCMDPVILRDPQSGQVTQCLATGAFPLINRHQCVASYESMGWVETTAAKAQLAQRDRVARRDAAVLAATEECRNARLQGELKSYAESVQCSNPRILAANQTAGYPFIDLIVHSNAARLADAEKLDKGQISEAEAVLHFAQVQSQIIEETRRRMLVEQTAQNQSSMAQAAQMQAQGALLSGLGAFNAANKPPPIPFYPMPV